MIVPVGAVGVDEPGATTARFVVTVYGSPTTVGSGRSDRIVTSVTALLTVMFALAPVLFVPPLEEVTELIVLVYGDADDCIPVTRSGKMQSTPLRRLPPLSVMTLLLTVNVPPPQVVAGPLLGTLIPAGSVSVNPTPVSVPGFVAGF